MTEKAGRHIHVAGPESAAILAALRTAAGVLPDWRADDYAALLLQSSVHALIVTKTEQPAGYVMFSLTAGEAEIYDVAVALPFRRQGLGAALLDAAIAAIGLAGGAELHLEVAVDNAAAIGLYERHGFAVSGRRRGYYARGTAPSVDALVMVRRV